MANTQYNYASLTQEVANDITQTAFNTSKRNCSNIQEYNTTIISGTTIKGNIAFDQVCTISGNDVINSSLDAQVESLLEALQKQQQTTETFFFQLSANTNVNKSIIKQQIKNNLVQTAINSCQQNISNVRRGNTLVLNNSTVEGSVTFTQSGDISTTCFIENLSKAIAFNKLKSEQDQAQSTSVGFGNILGIISAVAVVLVLGVVLYFVFTGKGGGGSNIKVLDTRKTGK